jgi:hypothetical protein
MTNEQLSFDSVPLYRNGAPDTSVKAALSLNVTHLEQMVYEAIRDAGHQGMTADELLQLFPDYSYSSITARPASLKRQGLVIDTGERRPGRSGRPQAVLKAKYLL